MVNKFWNWIKDETSENRTLYFDGVIAGESWWEDDITPAVFRSELFAEAGDVDIWLNSPGGDCVAASQIYSMLMEYPYNVNVKIDGMAASAASVIAMAGTRVLMAPTAVLMIHNPLTHAFGDKRELEKAISVLDEFKEAIINAYQIKSGLSRTKLAHLMDAETWMSAHKAVELGFADEILEDAKKEVVHLEPANYAFSRQATTNLLFNKICSKSSQPDPTSEPVIKSPERPVSELIERLNLMRY